MKGAVNTSSINKPNTFRSDGGLVPGSIPFSLVLENPAQHNIAATMYGYSSTVTHQPVIEGRIPTSSKQALVGAVLSRVLSMPENGLIRSLIGGPSGSVTIDLTQGCPSGSPTYWSRYIEAGQYKYGESCFSTGSQNNNTIYFGRDLRVISSPADAPWENQPLNIWGWEQKFVIAHELGHAVQAANDGSPTGMGYVMRSTASKCGCEHVMQGNQLHCLESAHYHADANKEGFAHYYATRTMNDRGASNGCAFNYYKTSWKVSVNPFVPLALSYQAKAPPSTVACNEPFRDPRSGLGSLTGWTRQHCNGTINAASERDWLTFLWAVDDLPSAPTASSRTALSDMMGIFGNSGNGSHFTWASVRQQAFDRLGPSKYDRFIARGTLHGVDR